MNKLVFVALFAVAFARVAIVPEMIAEVNRLDAGWTAGVNEYFLGKTLDEVRASLMPELNKPNLPKRYASAGVSVPDSFDARDEWPDCIHPIQNQGDCGSCWAFGAGEALEDRYCIASDGAINELLSKQYIVSCDYSDDGCNGGNLDDVWRFLKLTGTVTDACMPYVSGDSGYVPSCPTDCEDGSDMINYKVSKFFDISASVGAIQQEIQENGPIEVAFMVYEDFMSYTGGVYKHVSGSFLGGHAVKMIGWGTEDGQDYWLIANSWDTNWGEDGFFRIVRGDDECGIEDYCVAGTPKSAPGTEMILNDKLIAEVNRNGAKWHSGRNPRFEGVSRADVRAMLKTELKKPNLPKKVTFRSSVPDAFDSRTQWPDCIGEVRDQGACGSCWAFGATDTLGDRCCIEGYTKKIQLSEQYTTSCDPYDYGCNGGNLDNVWQFLTETGTVTDACMGYTSGGSGSVPACPSDCEDGSEMSFYKAQNAYDVSSSVADIQNEIYQNGPVEVAFNVYADFFSYTGGVYHHVSGALEGGHAVRMIGWGTDSGTDYWLIANSWGPGWGESGLFRIERGNNECGIESYVVVGQCLL